MNGSLRQNLAADGSKTADIRISGVIEAVSSSFALELSLIRITFYTSFFFRGFKSRPQPPFRSFFFTPSLEVYFSFGSPPQHRRHRQQYHDHYPFSFRRSLSLSLSDSVISSRCGSRIPLVGGERKRRGEGSGVVWVWGVGGSRGGGDRRRST